MRHALASVRRARGSRRGARDLVEREDDRVEQAGSAASLREPQRQLGDGRRRR